MHSETRFILKLLSRVWVLLVFLLSATCYSQSFELLPDEGVGVVLGGGGARGFAHLGVLRELERLHIPIRCIAGTSAGALIGGMYANGLDLDQMSEDFKRADWDQMLSGKVARSDIPYDKKRDDYKNYLDVSFGLKDGQLKVPRSAINSQQIEMFIRKLTQDRQIDSFDKLPLPFRAIATDLANGEAVVFDKGSLAEALRASMAVPGLFDLVETHGRLLVDGGLARNLPIQDAQQCAQHLIVVDVGTPPLKKDEINSLFDVVAQTSNLMVNRNVKEQLALLRPDDVVIRPALNGYNVASFVDNQAIIQSGSEAAAAQSAALSRYAISPERYAAWHQRLLLPAAPQIDTVQVVAPAGFVNHQELDKQLVGQAGPDTVNTVRETLRQIFFGGDFDRISYDIATQEGRNVLTVLPLEKNIGPNYLHFGLSLNSTTPGDSSFSFLASYQRDWVNGAGGSWRNELVLGTDKRFKSEFYQPFYYGSPFFVAGSASYQQQPLSFFDDTHIKYAEVSNDIMSLNGDLGMVLGPYGELRLGLYDSRVHSYVSMGEISLPPGDNSHDFLGLRASLVIDQFDNPRWPRSGYYLNAQLSADQPALGSFADSKLYNATAEDVMTFGDLTLRVSGKMRGTLNRAPDDYRLQSLGGFLNLTGYQAGELLGNRVAFSRLMLYWRAASLPSILGSGLYAGVSAEVGKVWDNPFTGNDTQWIPASSLFLAADTILGPFFIGVGNAKDGKLSAYIYLGADY